MDRIGRYKIDRELGRGAMGVVYHAIDPNIGRPVAIKTIRLGEVSNTQERARLRERLFREARSAGILSHPGIVTIYDVEQQGDLAYIAMEFVDGPTLDEVLTGAQPIGREQLFAILGQTAVALDYAHQKGIVHRDVKPANVMLTEDGSVKITDFGIAKITASEQFTMTGTIVGTPHYMAPEQVQGQAVDGRADQFSLAVMAFEMLTGEKPFTGEQLTTVVYKIVAEDPPPVERLNTTLTGQIGAVLRKGLAKKPDARYRNCQDFVDALETACAGARNWRPMARGAGASEPTMVGATRPELPPARSPRRDSTTMDTARRRRIGFLPVMLAVLMAAGLIGLIAWQAAPWIAHNAPAKQAEPAPAAAPPDQAEKRPSAAGPPVAPAASAPAAAPGTTVPAAESPPAPGTEAAAAKAPAAEAAAAKGPEAPPEKAAEPEPPPAPKPKVAVKPAEPEQEPEPQPVRRVPARPRSTVFEVLVPTNPPGATVTLDGRPETTCKSPCSVQAALGRHRIAITMPGYQAESREVDVTGTPLEVPLVSLRQAGGTLMLTSVPPGAAVYINGRAWNQSTPAQISLAPGTYNVTVEKNGKRASDRVEVRNGSTTYRKIPLEP